MIGGCVGYVAKKKRSRIRILIIRCCAEEVVEYEYEYDAKKTKRS